MGLFCMSYFLWLYIANISNRFRWLGQNIFRFGLLALGLEYLALAQAEKPVYYGQLYHYIDLTWLIVILAWLVILLPSENYIRSILTLYKRDNFLRDSLLARVLRLIKLTVKHDWLKREYSPGIYQKLVTPKRLKWLGILMYFYDLYLGYRRTFGEIAYFVVIYFGFSCATWIYVKFTGSQLYYYPTVLNSFDWGVAVIGFLIFKVLFIPSFSTLFSIGIRLVGKMLYYKLGISEWEQRLDQRLARYNRYKDVTHD